MIRAGGVKYGQALLFTPLAVFRNQSYSMNTDASHLRRCTLHVSNAAGNTNPSNVEIYHDQQARNNAQAQTHVNFSLVQLR